MKYIQVDIDVRAEEIEAVTGLLLINGITDTVVEDPADLNRLLNKEADYEWDYISDEVLEMKNRRPKITFYMDDTEESLRKIAEVSQKLAVSFPKASIKMLSADDSQWKDKWKEFFKPAKVGNRIVVKPTWEEYEAKEDELIIQIDPGMAFGTGTHETTSLCLRLMEEYLKPGESVLDVGCGSGILSVGAALLGAGKILAVDIDPEAIRASKQNVELNGCEYIVKVQEGNLVEGLNFKANLVVANLMADLVIELSSHVAEHMRNGGTYISSGILIEKKEEVEEAIKNCGFVIEEIREDGMWCAIVAALPTESL